MAIGTRQGLVPKPQQVKVSNPAPANNAATSSDNRNTGVFEFVQEQLAREFWVEKVYINIACWSQANGMVEMGKFFAHRAEEEREHAFRHINLLLDCGKTPRIPFDLDKSPDITCIDCALDHTYDTERKFTKYFAKMQQMALAEGEGRVATFADEFLEEQTEEERWSLSLVRLWKVCDGSKIDFEMAMKEFNAGNYAHWVGLKS